MMQGSYPMVRAVAAPEVDAAVIFDFNEHGSWFSSDTLRDGWSLGSPTRLAAAGDARTAWGPRRVEFSMRLRGSRAMAAQAQSALARWLLQPSGWLLFQLDAMTPPVWVRMVGAEPQDLDFGLIHATGERDIWDMGVAFDADPFLYGERATLFSGTVPNDPTVPGGMVAPLGLVPGDAPMPLRVTLSGMALSGWPLANLPHTVMSVGGPTAASGIWAFNVGAPDGATSVDANVSTVTGAAYAGGRARRIAFSASDGPTPLTNQFSVTALALPYGRYRTFVLVRSVSPAAVTFSGGVGGLVESVVTSWTAPNQQRWVDLGESSWPPGGHVEGQPGNGAASVTIRAARTSSTGAVDVSAIVLVPVSASTGAAVSSTLVSLPSSVTETPLDSLTLDSVMEAAWFARSGQTARSRRGHVGAWPAATPGEHSTLLLMRGVVQSATTIPALADDPADSTTVTVTGHPQWLYLPTL